MRPLALILALLAGAAQAQSIQCSSDRICSTPDGLLSASVSKAPACSFGSYSGTCAYSAPYDITAPGTYYLDAEGAVCSNTECKTLTAQFYRRETRVTSGRLAGRTQVYWYLMAWEVR